MGVKWTDESAAEAKANADAGLRLRVGWVLRLREELFRIRQTYSDMMAPVDLDRIDKTLEETKEWLDPRYL